MALLMTGLWQLAIAMIIFFNISATLPSAERHQRQVELKLIHNAGLRREYEKTVKLLQEMLDYKRSVPDTVGTKDATDFSDSNNDSWSSEEKFIKLKTCLQFVKNLDARFPDSDAKDSTPMIRHSICQLVVELNEAALEAPADENQE